jgi:hypothetical protein
MNLKKASRERARAQGVTAGFFFSPLPFSPFPLFALSPFIFYCVHAGA